MGIKAGSKVAGDLSSKCLPYPASPLPGFFLTFPQWRPNTNPHPTRGQCRSFQCPEDKGLMGRGGGCGKEEEAQRGRGGWIPASEGRRWMKSPRWASAPAPLPARPPQYCSGLTQSRGSPSHSLLSPSQLVTHYCSLRLAARGPAGPPCAQENGQGRSDPGGREGAQRGWKRSRSPSAGLRFQWPGRGVVGPLPRLPYGPQLCTRG